MTHEVMVQGLRTSNTRLRFPLQRAKQTRQHQSVINNATIDGNILGDVQMVSLVVRLSIHSSTVPLIR